MVCLNEAHMYVNERHWAYVNSTRSFFVLLACVQVHFLHFDVQPAHDTYLLRPFGETPL